MNIVATQYNLEQRALEIYVAGCNNHCPGCHNPRLQNFNIGTPYEYWLEKINNKIEEFDDMIDNIWLLGGEPLDQDKFYLEAFILFLNQFNKKIWLFTGHTLSDALYLLPYETENYIEYIKYGMYDENDLTEDNICYGVKLASGNQEIVKVSDL